MLILKLFSRLPFWALYLLSDVLFFVSYHVVRYRRTLVRKNLMNSFPEKSVIELRSIEKAFYHNLSDYAVETLKLPTLSEAELKKRMVYADFDVVKPYAAQQQSVILLASHTFNWEWLLASGTLYLPLAIDFVYQPQRSELFNTFSLAGRTRFGAYPIERKKVAREAVRRKEILRGIAIVADQYPGYKHDKKYITTFLNQQTAFFFGANQLAVLMQYPVVYVEVRKIKRGYYETRLVPISQPPYTADTETVAAAYALAVEKLIRERPAEWLWSHNRWKKKHFTPASAQYPPASTAS
jgi:KDO2-lipid IV(A) lauroyltransferase